MQLLLKVFGLGLRGGGLGLGTSVDITEQTDHVCAEASLCTRVDLHVLVVTSDLLDAFYMRKR
jgi:hypothetical protein